MDAAKGDVSLPEGEVVSWAAYHARSQHARDVTENSKDQLAITSLLPLFYNQSKSIDMIRHSMDMIKRAVDTLNPNQVPVVTLDQPLYTLAKQIQWRWPDSHGEDHFVILFGGLHIEMTALKVLGDLLEKSGWTNALVLSGLSSMGTAESYLKASHVTRTRRAHQVTASSLYILLNQAYGNYVAKRAENESLLPFEDWCNKRSNDSPQFKFWFMILQLELLVLIFIRSIRESNFLLYINALTKIVPWFFALGHTNYARWIPIHLRDMLNLESKHPRVFSQFMMGNFTVRKTGRPFSAIAIDQAHEQNNALVKGDGGAIGLTENPSALHRWMVSGPEMARLINEFQISDQGKSQKSRNLNHHEDTKQKQVHFHKDTRALTDTIDSFGNPFSEESKDLLVLDSRNLVDSSVIHTMYHIEKLGAEQYHTFVSERLTTRSKPISDPIKKNNLSLFKTPTMKEKSRAQQKIVSLKNDCSLFSKLFIASQIRTGDLDDFFAHENQAYPPVLSQMGKINMGTKSDLVDCLESLVTAREDTSTAPSVEMLVLDGAAVVNMLQPRNASTFSQYASIVFLPYIKYQLRSVKRLDIVWDRYFSDSLKSETRKQRGLGIRRRVEPDNAIPKDWHAFLRIDDNKSELFAFLSDEVMKIETDKTVITTHNENVRCTLQQSVAGLEPCSHEEADTRIFVHVNDAVKNGFKKIAIRTVDTDVVVLAVRMASLLNIPELWIAFGTGKHLRYLSAHDIASALGSEKCKGLTFFHAFTGCDIVSSFSGKGKKSAWETWTKCAENLQFTSTFMALASPINESGVESHVEVLERFVILLYDRASTLSNVNDARKYLFTQKNRSIDNIPPTSAALRQHIKRAVYQAGICWSQMTVLAPRLQSPSDWGWIKTDGRWNVHWTDLPQASKACRQLVRCGCSSSIGCKTRCTCIKAALQCTALCKCAGLCTRS